MLRYRRESGVEYRNRIDLVLSFNSIDIVPNSDARSIPPFIGIVYLVLSLLSFRSSAHGGRLSGVVLRFSKGSIHLRRPFALFVLPGREGCFIEVACVSSVEQSGVSLGRIE